ncbi:hypothetical protein CFC21_009365 [Triticum aestivum]|uniref:F-box domain-containing protein n=2 Tax=Triticum aestivum TaxID=4565 RepID=A0A9R1DJ24_WHEAT|nr:hypothetical protein CFC21_009365 [Triticum aestivum]
MEKRRRKEEEEEEEQAVEGLPNDLVWEFLSRVPYRSLCRFKSVSTSWLTLCSDPTVRRRSPQTLSGFFGLSRSGSIRFVNLSGRGRPLVDPSLPYLHGFKSVKLLNCCSGILLCHGMQADGAQYIVCNPATEEIWAVIPVPDRHETPNPLVYRTICLCFDPAVPSRFAVFVIIDNGHDITIMEVYSSDTAEWTSMSSRWGHRIVLFNYEPAYFFLNGALHSVAYDSRLETFDSNGKSINMVVTVDTGGNTWRITGQPLTAKFTFIGFSQGRLHGIEMEDGGGYRISVWILKDYASGQWTLKHTTSVQELLGRPCIKNKECYAFVALHPEHNLIFLNGGVDPEHTLMSYDMDTQKLHVICNLEDYEMEDFRPYIPCFVEWRPSNAP